MRNSLLFYFMLFLSLSGAEVYSPEIYSPEIYSPHVKEQKVVTSKKKIDIPEFPGAHNPSLIQFNDGYLLTFRFIPNLKFYSWISYIGVMLLDKSFDPISEPQLLHTRFNDQRTPSQSEDARVFASNGKLYLIYNDNMQKEIPTKKDRRDMYLAELSCVDGNFKVSDPLLLIYGAYSDILWQKNWVPFDWNGTLLLSYSINPHEVICPDLLTGFCEKWHSTSKAIEWPLGPLRGGTPALLVDGEYLAFFHSGIKLPSHCTENRPLWHYFMGAYTFSPDPPFQLTSISQNPIDAPGFYTYSSYSKRIIYPNGFVVEGSTLYISYGKDDCEIWIATIDLHELKKTMVSLQ